MFIVSLNYLCELSDIDQYLEEHRAFLRDEYAKGHFLASGPKQPRTGGVILATVDSREELDAILVNDPFHREKLIEYDIQEFIPTMVAEGFEGLLGAS